MALFELVVVCVALRDASFYMVILFHAALELIRELLSKF